MAATGFTPIQLYRTTTASAQPSAGNLADGELAINLTDKKLYAKDASNNVYVLADASSGGTTATNLAGGAAGSLPYQTGANATTFLGIGTAAQVLQVNSGATAPQWVNTSGTGDVARTTSPSFTTPSLGAATALSINSLTITTSTGTFTLANGKTLTVNNSLTLSGTDATTMTFPSTSATIARTDAAQTFTGTQTVQAAATQDAVALAGRAGGTSSYVSTLTPTTLSASRTVTLPDADTTVPVATQVLTFTGPTAGRTITLPDANFTVARSDAAQSFTGTQTFLSNPVLDAGTANGVLYLNGSKVVTSGSALTFDGTGLAVNTASPISGGKFSALADLTAVNGLVLRDSATTYANNDNYVLLQNSTGITVGGLTHPAANSLGVWGNDDIRFLQSAAATEQMRLTSTGLGIGTSSPSYKLDIGGTNPRIRINETTGFVLTSYVNTGGSFDVGRDNSAGLISGAAYAGFLNVGGAYPLIFNTNGAERMRLDASGNLGLGVTPSAWSTTANIQLATGRNISAGTGIGLYGNAYFNAGWRYIDSVAATGYGQSNGSHSWFTAPSGTAGDPITFTQAMTLDASGNLLVGRTTPLTQITFSGTDGITYQRSTDNSFSGVLDYLKSRGSAASPTAVQNGDDLFTLRAAPYHGSAYTYLTNTIVQVDGTFTSGQNPPTRISWYTNVANGSSTERMRLDASGNLGLDVTPSGWGTSAFQTKVASVWGFSNNAYVGCNYYFDGSDRRYIATASASEYAQFNGQHTWYNAPSGTAGNAISFTQAMTLDASGNLLVGTTGNGAGARLKSKVAAGTFGLEVTDEVQSDFIVSPLSGAVCRVGPSAGAMALYAGNTERARIPAAGGMVVGTAALATTATDGFLYVPTCAGTPTGTPTTQTGTAPIVVDTTNNKLYFYSGGQWRDAGP